MSYKSPANPPTSITRGSVN